MRENDMRTSVNGMRMRENGILTRRNAMRMRENGVRARENAILTRARILFSPIKYRSVRELGAGHLRGVADEEAAARDGRDVPGAPL